MAPASDPGGAYQFLVDSGGAGVERDEVWITDEDDKRGGRATGDG